MFADGTYSLNGNVFQFETTDIWTLNTDNFEWEWERYTSDNVLSGTYTIELIDSETLLLIQTSEEGFFDYQKAGHQIVLKKGHFS